MPVLLPNMKSNLNYDAVVIGGRPDGPPTPAVLAAKGRRVILLEKDKSPRYHIGESLIPFCYFPLQRLGLIEKMKASHFTKKYSIQFVSSTGRQSHPFYFFEHMQHECSNTWQVWRGEYDKMLLENAREKGVEVLEETLVKDVIRENGAVTGVIAAGKDGATTEFRAPMTVDASGRDAFLQSRTGWKVRDQALNKIAVWTYYKGAQLDQGIDAGATTVAYLPEKGWFWYIPLPGDTVSVGVVAEKNYLYKDSRDLETIFQSAVQQNNWIKEHLAVGQQTGPYRVTGEYSYRSQYCASDGLILAGDAFAFLDPVFSSEVFLALRIRDMAGDAVDAALSKGDVSASQFAAYGEELCRGIEAMRRLVYAFYYHAFTFRRFLTQNPHLRPAVTHTLIDTVY